MVDTVVAYIHVIQLVCMYAAVVVEQDECDTPIQMIHLTHLMIHLVPILLMALCPPKNFVLIPTAGFPRISLKVS